MDHDHNSKSILFYSCCQLFPLGCLEVLYMIFRIQNCRLRQAQLLSLQGRHQVLQEPVNWMNFNKFHRYNGFPASYLDLNRNNFFLLTLLCDVGLNISAYYFFHIIRQFPKKIHFKKSVFYI